MEALLSRSLLRRSVMVSIIAFAALGAGCDHESAALMDPQPPGKGISAITVTPVAAELAVGDTMRFHAVLKRPTAAVVWSSSRPEVVQIDSLTGFVRALAPGWVTLTAALRDENFRAGAQVTVIPHP